MDGEHLRVVLRGVCRALDAGHAEVERPVALSLVQTQDDILVVAGVVDLLVEAHGVLRSGVAEDLLEGIHLGAVVHYGVINLLPLELADVGPRVQLTQVHGTLYGEVVSRKIDNADQRQEKSDKRFL